MKSKSQIYKHFNYRLKKRYNISITINEYFLLIEKCKQRKIQIIKPDKYKNRLIVIIDINNEEVYCIYDKEYCVLRTCLLKDWV